MRQRWNGQYGHAIFFELCHRCGDPILDLIGLVMVDGYAMRKQDILPG